MQPRPYIEPRTGPGRKVTGYNYRGRGRGFQMFLACGRTVLGRYAGQITERCHHCDAEERACRDNRPTAAKHAKGSRTEAAYPCFYCDQFNRRAMEVAA